MAEEKLIGKIVHYFSHLGVAAIQLTDDGLSVGDTIHIKGHTTDVTQTIDSMQIEKQKVEKAKKGESIGIKVEGKVRDGDEVYKIIE